MGEFCLHLRQHRLRPYALGNVDHADQQLAGSDCLSGEAGSEHCVEGFAAKLAELALSGVAGFAGDSRQHAGGIDVVALFRPVVIERPQHLGFVAPAKQGHGLIVHVDDACCAHHRPHELWMLCEVTGVVLDALRAQLAQHPTDGREIQLPERSCHRLKEIAIAILALAQSLLGGLSWMFAVAHAPS